jgi:acylpyruvate hydrolase
MRLASIHSERGTFAAILSTAGAHPVLDPTGKRFRDVGALLASPGNWREPAEAALARHPETFEDDELRRPILDPGAVIAVGLNYASHIREMGRELPRAPTLFSMLPRALTDPHAPIELPAAASERVDYEGELGIIIAAGGRRLSPAQTRDAVAGVCVINDITMRDYQRRSLQWFAGKSWERSTPVGPWLTTLDDVDLDNAELEVTVDGERRQHARIDDLVFGLEQLVADISTIVTLQPGDIIATGTPGGVADAMDPPRYLRAGQTCEVSITGLGTLRNTFHTATPTSSDTPHAAEMLR